MTVEILIFATIVLLIIIGVLLGKDYLKDKSTPEVIIQIPLPPNAIMTDEKNKMVNRLTETYIQDVMNVYKGENLNLPER